MARANWHRCLRWWWSRWLAVLTRPRLCGLCVIVAAGALLPVSLVLRYHLPPRDRGDLPQSPPPRRQAASRGALLATSRRASYGDWTCPFGELPGHFQQPADKGSAPKNGSSWQHIAGLWRVWYSNGLLLLNHVG